MIELRKLDESDRGYVLSSWRESHKPSPSSDKVPWPIYKDWYGKMFERVLDDPSTVAIGAYDLDDTLVGWLVMTPSKRVHTLHWVYVKWKDQMRRRGIMTMLLDAAELLQPGRPFVYTLRARRDRARLPDGSMSKSFDESLVAALRARGVIATYVALKDWLK